MRRKFPTERGMRLGWVNLTFLIMGETLGFRPTTEERTYILLRALESLPRNGECKQIKLSEEDEAEVQNAALAACLDVKFDPAWRWKCRRKP